MYVKRRFPKSCHYEKDNSTNYSSRAGYSVGCANIVHFKFDLCPVGLRNECAIQNYNVGFYPWLDNFIDFSVESRI